MSPRAPRRRLPALAAILLLPALFGACSPILDMDLSNLCEGVGPLARVEVSPSTVAIRAGDSVFVGATQRDSKGNDRFLCGADSVSWSSQSAGIATVRGDILGAWIRGVSAGQTSVRASAASKSADLSVTVTGR